MWGGREGWDKGDPSFPPGGRPGWQGGERVRRSRVRRIGRARVTMPGPAGAPRRTRRFQILNRKDPMAQMGRQRAGAPAVSSKDKLDYFKDNIQTQD